MILTNSTVRRYVKGTVNGEYIDGSPGQEYKFNIENVTGNKLTWTYQYPNARTGKTELKTNVVELLDKDRIRITGAEAIVYRRYSGDVESVASQ